MIIATIIRLIARLLNGNKDANGQAGRQSRRD
jgi:hypothetical protein